MNTSEKLIKFVNQRPGLDFANYGNVRLYRQESREITRDRQDFFELYSLANSLSYDFEKKLTKELENTSGRLCLKNGELEYGTCQYFPTEYRPAACRILVSVIWDIIRDEHHDFNGIDIRKFAKKRLSRRVARNYFN